MRISGTMVTTPTTQMQILDAKNTRAAVKVAKETESVEVMEKIIESEQPRLLVALASNNNLPQEIEARLADLGEKYPAITKALVDRRE